MGNTKEIGKEYVEENQEKGITEEKKNKIISTSIKNEKGIETSVFERGDTIEISLRYFITDIEKQLHVGLGIIDKVTGFWVCGNNTLYDKKNIAWKKGDNYVTLSFPHNMFHKGDFVFSTSLFSEDENKDQIFYDMYNSVDHQQSFRVIPKDNRKGVVFMEHDWS